MPDYKEMYFKMFQASEKALDIIIQAQQECEEAYVANSWPELQVFSPSAGEKLDTEDE